MEVSIEWSLEHPILVTDWLHNKRTDKYAVIIAKLPMVQYR